MKNVLKFLVLALVILSVTGLTTACTYVHNNGGPGWHGGWHR
jgi:hypothetical protein